MTENQWTMTAATELAEGDRVLVYGQTARVSRIFKSYLIDGSLLSMRVSLNDGRTVTARPDTTFAVDNTDH